MKIVNGLLATFSLTLLAHAAFAAVTVSAEDCAATPTYNDLMQKYAGQMTAAASANNNSLYQQAQANYNSAKQSAAACSKLSSNTIPTSTQNPQ